MEPIRRGAASSVDYSPAPPIDGEDLSSTEEARRGLRRARLVWDQRRRVFRVTGMCALLITIGVLLFPNRYESTTRVVPPEQQSVSSMAMMAAASKLGGSSGGSGAAASMGGLGGRAIEMLLRGNGDTGLFIGILQSRTVQDHMIDKFDLRRVYWVRTYKGAREKLSDRTDITEDHKTSVLTIKVIDNDRRRAAAMAREYVAELNRLAAALNTSSAHRERVFIEERLKTVKQELDGAAKLLSEFSSKNTMIDLKEQGKAMVESAAILQGQLIATQSELQGLEQIYTGQNVRVRATRARVEELKRQLDNMGGTDASLAVGAKSDDLYPSIRKLPILGLTFADLYRKTKILEVVFELLTQQYEMAKIQEVKELPTIRVLDEADVPERHVFPPRLLLITLGIMFSFGFAVLLVSVEAAWKQVPAEDERKLLVGEMLVTGKVRLQEAGRRLRENSKEPRLWRRFLRRDRDGNTNGEPPRE